jgi:hypothetical protein
MALIIGSTAMYRLFPDEVREPKDLDLFARPYTWEGAAKDQWWVDNNKVNDVFWHESFAGTQLDRNGFATLNELYTIKVSHSYWELKNNSWDKHLWDILYMQDRGAQLDFELHQMLYKVWIEKHGSKKMNLAQAAGMFFKDAVVRIYDHDSIHDSVAYGDHPLYERILKDGETVDIDPDKLWNGLTFDEQVLLFREEICATALERWMIPTEYKFSPGLAYKLALKKTITSLTKGKSARFIVTNFRHFMNPHDYMSIHMSKRDKLIPLEKADG